MRCCWKSFTKIYKLHNIVALNNNNGTNVPVTDGSWHARAFSKKTGCLINLICEEDENILSAQSQLTAASSSEDENASTSIQFRKIITRDSSYVTKASLLPITILCLYLLKWIFNNNNKCDKKYHILFFCGLSLQVNKCQKHLKVIEKMWQLAMQCKQY